MVWIAATSFGVHGLNRTLRGIGDLFGRFIQSNELTGRLSRITLNPSFNQKKRLTFIKRSITKK